MIGKSLPKVYGLSQYSLACCLVFPRLQPSAFRPVKQTILPFIPRRNAEAAGRVSWGPNWDGKESRQLDESGFSALSPCLRLSVSTAPIGDEQRPSIFCTKMIKKYRLRVMRAALIADSSSQSLSGAGARLRGFSRRVNRRKGERDDPVVPQFQLRVRRKPPGCAAKRSGAAWQRGILVS